MSVLDPTYNVEGSIDRIISKFSSYSETYTNSLQSCIAQIKRLNDELLSDSDPDAELSVTGVMIWEQCLNKLETVLTQMSTEHRAMHSGISKCGKEIDKGFVSDFKGVCRSGQTYETDPELRQKMNNLVAEHFLTRGYMDLAEKFAKESGVDLDSKNQALFLELSAIVNALKEKNLEPALNWAKEHSSQLRERGSTLEFSLLRLKFLELLRRGPDAQMEALSFVPNFHPFATRHYKEIQTLMGALLFIRQGLGQSPYRQLLDDALWAEISDLFVRDACALLELPVHSPLSLILSAGTVALPNLLNLRHVMQQRKVFDVWTHSEELPIEIDLGPEHHYHSVFACPILRQQTTESNPPMRLVCGHVISKDALNKLANGNRLKCPYCPVESVVGEAKRVYF